MMRNLTFQRELIKNIYDEMLPIFIAHYKEIAHYQDIQLEPNVSEYYKMEDSGICHTFTVREDGALIGYAVFLIRHHLHYKSSKQAWQDIIYISKEKRGFGKDFIQWCDLQLKNMGVQVVNHHVKFSHDWSTALEKIGYVRQDIHLTKRLDK